MGTVEHLPVKYNLQTTFTRRLYYDRWVSMILRTGFSISLFVQVNSKRKEASKQIKTQNNKLSKSFISDCAEAVYEKFPHMGIQIAGHKDAN